jgi:hypothetical protein
MAKVYATGKGRAGAKWAVTGSSVGKVWRIEGIENVTRNINAKLMTMKGKTAVGLVEAANYIMVDADSRTPPLVPEDKGDLRASTFTKALKDPVTGDPYVLYGYEKNYAAAVHEMLFSPTGKPINWSRPGSGPRWFEASIKRNAPRVIQIVSKYAQV